MYKNITSTIKQLGYKTKISFLLTMVFLYLTYSVKTRQLYLILAFFTIMFVLVFLLNIYVEWENYIKRDSRSS